MIKCTKIECLFSSSSVTSFQCLTDISSSCRQGHRKAPKAPAPAPQEARPGPSQQPLAAPDQATRPANASTFQAPRPGAATSSQ